MSQGTAAEVRTDLDVRTPGAELVNPSHSGPELSLRAEPVHGPARVIPLPASTRDSPWRISRCSVDIFGQHLDFRIVLLGLADGVVFAFAIHFATLGWFASEPSQRGLFYSIDAELMLFHICTMVCLVAVGLYNRRLAPRTSAVLARVLVGFVLAGGVMAALMFVFPPLRVERALMAATFVIALPLLGVSRALFVRVLGPDRFSRRVLVYGCGIRARELRQVRVRKDLLGYQVVGFVLTEGCPRPAAPEQYILPPEDLQAFVREHQIDEVIVAMDDRRRGLPVEQLLRCRLAGVPVTDVLTFIERESGKVELSAFYPSWLIFSDGVNRRGLIRLVSRVFDLAAALVLLLVTLPFMLLAALAIWLESGGRGPIFYSQERVGLNGERFVLHKLRTMTVDAEKNGPQWAIDNDPRITRIGNFLRRTRLDEVPQLYNVLKGDMSFVGPRPERPQFVEQLSHRIPYYRERHCVKPGITGWAQLCYRYGASEQDALEKLQYDLYYLKHKSLLFDLVILLQTAEVVLWRTGSR